MIYIKGIRKKYILIYFFISLQIAITLAEKIYTKFCTTYHKIKRSEQNSIIIIFNLYIDLVIFYALTWPDLKNMVCKDISKHI